MTETFGKASRATSSRRKRLTSGRRFSFQPPHDSKRREVAATDASPDASGSKSSASKRTRIGAGGGPGENGGGGATPRRRGGAAFVGFPGYPSLAACARNRANTLDGGLPRMRLQMASRATRMFA